MDGVLRPILKTLNSLLGSLSKVFPIIHVAKEAKEMMEATFDRLGPDADLTVVKIEPPRLF